MHLTALLLSRLQFGFTISFHIIFPAFTIGLAAWLAFLETMSVVTGHAVYRRLFDFWLRIFAVSFGLGVVSGIVMEFQFGTNWSELSRRSGSIQGGLLAYESYTAFALEAAFFGVLLFGRDKVNPVLYMVSAIMVALGTNISSFWIMANNSWMQHPVGFASDARGVFVPTHWVQILFNYVSIVRFLHMILAAYCTTAFCVAATGAWYALRRTHLAEAQAMLTMGLRLAAILMPLQLVAGHLVGGYVAADQPSKISALEGRWHTQQPANEVLFGIPDPAHDRNDFQIALPAPMGSLIDSDNPKAREVGITSIPPQDRPPVAIVFFTFRFMVGLGVLMLLLAWGGALYGWRGRLEQTRWLLWPIFLSFPSGFLAILAGWFTAEVGRQPWVIFGQLRTADALSPHLTAVDVGGTLLLFGTIYAVIFFSGTLFIYRMLRKGPVPISAVSSAASNPKRPMAVPDRGAHASPAE
jgi:cytochrome d ubiquinol oxidase subunit I